MPFYKNKTFWYMSLAATVFVTDIYIYFNLKGNSKVLSTAAISLDKKTKPALFEKSSKAQNQDITNDSESALALNISRAESLTKEYVQQMTSTAVDTNQNQDRRFESIFLLAHNRLIPHILKDIAETPIPSELNEPELDFEHIVRAQAIEGIELSREKDLSKQIIEDLMAKTDDSFLLDRLQRAHNSLTGRTSSSEVQDNQMLEKIIGN